MNDAFFICVVCGNEVPLTEENLKRYDAQQVRYAATEGAGVFLCTEVCEADLLEARLG